MDVASHKRANMIRTTFLLILGALAQYWWRDYALGVLTLVAVAVAMRMLWVEVRTPTLTDACSGNCQQGRNCDCE
jgi:hypothetical protein